MSDFDVLIIGGGPGGYTAAIRASQLGLKTALIEKDNLGGICGNWGCIPSKALIHQAQLFSQTSVLNSLGIKLDYSGFNYSTVLDKSRAAAARSEKGVQYLLKKNKVEVFKASASVSAPGRVKLDSGQELTASAVILATGSQSRTLPGLSFDENLILSSTGALSLKTLPKTMIILGSGAIGMEFAYIFASFGVKVTVVEALDRILPQEDKQASDVLVKSLSKKGIQFLPAQKVEKVETSSASVTAHLASGQTIEADKILVAIGRKPNSDDLGLEALGITLEKGFIPVGEYNQTSLEGLFAIGDLVNTPLLAHVASKEGEIVVEYIAHKLKGTPLPQDKNVDPECVPACIFTEPQVASFGLTEQTLQTKEIAFKAYAFPYLGLGKASALEQTEGFIKVLATPDGQKILAAHAVGLNASEIIHELLLAKTSGLTVEQVANTIHAHPTISEGVMEATKGFLGHPINI